MAERSTIAQAVQLGVETTTGTAVAATKKLLATGLELNIASDTSTFRPAGAKYATVVYAGREWTDVAVSGVPSYSELQYLFSSLMATPTVAQIMDSATPTGAYRWTFNPATFGADTVKSYTIEQGDSVRAHRASNVLISGVTLGWNRGEMSLDGDGLAAAIEDGVTLTSSGVTSIDAQPILPTQVSIYADTTSAGLGTTKLLRNIGGEFALTDRFSTLFVVDAAQPSFVATLESEPTATFTIQVEADALGMAHLNKFRTGATVFLRFEAIGSKIYDATTDQFHTLRIDVAGKVSDVSDFSDEDGVYAIEYTFTAVHDATWGKALTVELINKQTAL